MKNARKSNLGKRVFAVLLAFSLCAGYLLIPAAADEDDGGVVVVTETTTTTSGGVTHTETTTTETQKTEDTTGGATEGNGNTSTPTVTSDTTVTKTESTETTKDVTDTQGSKTVYESQEVNGEQTTTVTQETKTEHTETETKPAEDSFKDEDYTEKSTDSTTVTEPTSSTESTEPVSLDTPQSPNVTLEMNAQNNKTDSERIDAAGSAAKKYELNGITEKTTVSDNGKEAEKTESGRTIVVQEPIYMDEAKKVIIGYQIVTTNVKVAEETTDNTTAGTAEKPVISTDDPVTESSSTKTTYEMPTKPEGGVTKNSDGTTVTTTVEEIKEGDEVVGYKTTSVTTDSHGKELNRSSESIYRTEITTKTEEVSVTTTTTTKTPLSNERTTTTVTTTIVDTEGHVLVPALGQDGNWYWVYTGTLGNVTTGDGNGAIDMDSLKPTQTEPAVGTVNKTTDLYNRKDANPNNTNLTPGFPLKWVGEYGLESAIRVLAKDHDGDIVYTYQPHQFILRSQDGKNEAFYVYCADFEVNPQNGHGYGMENLEDATYYDNEAAKHIRYIALNGYWGTNGKVGTKEYLGSLDAVKALMAASGKFTKAEIDALTPGEAITATQAAIWYYGNSSKNPNSGIYDDKNVVGWYYNGDKSDPKWTVVSSAKTNTVNKLFNLLIDGTQEAAAGTTIINENNFATAANLEIKEKISNATTLNGSQPQTTQPDTYKTDLSFSLLLEPNEGDELFVTVLDSNNNELKRVALCGKDSESKWQQWLFRDKNQMYTIEDLEIAEGVNITLNLSGTQNLKSGVYLYTSEIKKGVGSQTFVGVANGTRNVNLNVDLKFEVQDPKLAVKNSNTSATSTKTDTKVENGKGTRTEVTESKHITVTQTVTQSTRRTWTSSWAKRYPGDNGDGGEETGGNRRPGVRKLLNLDETKKNELTIPDEQVPLAKAPVTGDISILWLTLGCLSLAGMLLLNRKRRIAG